MICKNCSKEFIEKYSNYSNGDFCSKSCGTSYARKQSPKGTKKVKCITCGKELEVDKRSSPKQCKCDNCRGYKKIQNEKFCLNCGKIRTNKYKGKFCNYNCIKEYQYKKYINDWKNGKVDGSKSKGTAMSGYIRRYLWEKYNSKCSRCGWDIPNPITKKPILEIEHKDGNSENNKEENLDLICLNCHGLTLTYRALNYGKGNRKRLKYYKLI